MVKVTLWGLGAMGSGIARLLRQRNYPIAAVWEQNKDKLNRSLGEVLDDQGPAGPDITEFNGKFPEKGNLLIIATGSTVLEVAPLIRHGVKAGQNVLTIAEEMAYPWASNPEIARTLDQEAKEQGVRVLGTGINPGFVLDALVGFITTPCTQVDKVYARRVNDLSPFGPTVLRTQGVGTSPEEFNRGLETGAIVGHVGFPESVYMIAAMLGWEISRIDQVRDPIISHVSRTTPYISIEPGQVAGCNHRAKAYDGGGNLVIELEHPQQICPELAGVDTGDHITIEGTPKIQMDIKPEIPGGTGTIAVAVNVIPKLLQAEPGLLTMNKLVIPSYGR